MTVDVRINGYSLRDVLVGPPSISDSTDAVCRVLDVAVRNVEGIGTLMGKEIELWYGGKRWYHGWVQKRGIDTSGNTTLTAYDGLFFFKKHTDDFYFKNMTATQVIKALAPRVGVRVAGLANTGAVFKALWYPGGAADKIAVDVLVRTFKANGKKFWLRYDPVAQGISLFERVKPTEAWAFLSTVNLVEASYEESAEDMFNVVKLVDRETGKVAIRRDAKSVTDYLQRQHFEEVDKDAVKMIGKLADQKLKELSKIDVSMSMSGINPDNTMPQLFSGDVVYVEEKITGIVGAYHIDNVKQEFVNDKLITIAADLKYAIDIPALQYDDATTKPDFLKTAKEKEAEKKAEAAKKKKEKKDKKAGTKTDTKK